MNRLLAHAFGPELYWLLICVGAKILALRNTPSTEAGNLHLEHVSWVIPLALVPLVFAFYFAPGSARWWLLFRIDLATCIGSTVAVTVLLNAINYHDSRNSGVGSAYIALIALGIFAVAVGTVVTAIVLWWRSRGGV